METLQKIALIFTIIGAINWGLIGFFDFNWLLVYSKTLVLLPELFMLLLVFVELLIFSYYLATLKKTPNKLEV